MKLKSNRWQKWQIRFLLDNYNVMGSEEIAENVGRTYDSVVWKLGSMGIIRSGDYLHEIRSTGKAAVARRKLFKEWDKKFGC